MPLPPATREYQLRSGPRRAILAIDYGRTRIGLALSDSPELPARPLAVLRRTNRRDDVKRLRELCRKHSVGKIIVGWPIRLDGTPGAMAAESEQFAARLRKQLGLPVELIDERLSSWEAGQLSRTTKPVANAPLGKRKTLDDIAAAVVLRDYLSRVGRGAQG
jgi:putative holliday junction resolvase